MDFFLSLTLKKALQKFLERQVTSPQHLSYLQKELPNTSSTVMPLAGQSLHSRG